MTRPNLKKRPLRSSALAVLVSVLGLGAIAGCGSDSNSATGSDGSTELSGTITVSAATSLTAAFEELAEDFEAQHHGVNVELSFGSSSTNASQIIDGAPADVFASADTTSMDLLVDAGEVDESTTFARNRLVIVTKPGNPTGIDDIDDFDDAAELGVISLCGETAPCGRYAAELLAAAGVSIPESSVTRGQNVGATLTAVTEGDALAGIVYITDATTAGDAVAVVEIPSADNVLATYPIALLRSSRNQAVGNAFVEYVASDHGRSVLEGYGFLPPR